MSCMSKVLVTMLLSVVAVANASSWHTVKVSAYTPTVGQTDNNPHITATGARVRSGIVALSRNLLRSFPYHSYVEIRCGNYFWKTYRVEDTMARSQYNKVDIFMWSYSEAIKWGVKTCRVRGL